MFKRLNTVVVGAGLGGLSAALALRRAGHKVTVLESAKQLTDLGAGIQIPPNSSRILDAWGLLEEFKEKAVQPPNFNVRRYSTGEIIGCTPLNPRTTELYGHPYMLIYRPDYQQILYNAVKKAGAQIITNARVDSVHDNTILPFVKLMDGTIYSADLILGADGIRSRVRLTVMPDDVVHPRFSTICAYRCTLPVEAIHADPDIAHLMHDFSHNCWVGYRRHIVAYPMKNGHLYNLVLCHPGEASLGNWNEPGNLDELKHHYHRFDPTIQKLLTKITGCLKWALVDLPMLSHWVSPISGKVALIGDAAHAMLPHLAQGAAQAMEDSACLGVLFSQVQSKDEIPHLLRLYEKIRKPRAERFQKGSAENGEVWHLPDGEYQIARDISMKMTHEERESSPKVKNVNQWSDPSVLSWMFGYNVVTATQKALRESRLKGQSGEEQRASL